jgi:hypothetical protein
LGNFLENLGPGGWSTLELGYSRVVTSSPHVIRPVVFGSDQKTTNAVAEFIVWVVALFQRNDWFKLLVLGGVVLALLGSVLKGFL